MCKRNAMNRPSPRPHWFDHVHHADGVDGVGDEQRQRERFAARRARRRRRCPAAVGPLRVIPLAFLLIAVGPAILFALSRVFRVVRTVLVALLGALGEVLITLFELLTHSWVSVLVFALLARKLLRRRARRLARAAGPAPVHADEHDVSVAQSLTAKPAAPASPISPMSASSTLHELTLATSRLLHARRSALPAGTANSIESILNQLAALKAQLEQPGGDKLRDEELHGLLRDELPELLRAYDNVPKTLRGRALHGGASPEQQLLAGLVTIDEQLGRIHERLASDALKALATHQRFLDLKYGRGDGPSPLDP